MNTGQQLVTTWGFRGAFAQLEPLLEHLQILRAYARYHLHNDTAKTLLCGVSGVGGSVRTTLNALGSAIFLQPPTTISRRLAPRAQWTPVKNPSPQPSPHPPPPHLDQEVCWYGGGACSAAIGKKPAALYELKDRKIL